MAVNVTVVGIGPGHPDYLPPVAKRAIRSAHVLIGSRRALATFGKENQRQIVISGQLAEVTEVINKYKLTAKIAVLVSGDPGFYSLVPYLLQHLPPEDMEIIPGLSSMQVAFCRIKTVWQDADLLSLHGRSFESIRTILTKPGKVGFLTDPEHTPAHIADYLLKAGWPNCPVYLCEKLSYPDERIVCTDLASTIGEQGFSHSVMVVLGHE